MIDDAKECIELVNTALNKPLRNCDVGSMNEQYAHYCRNIEKYNGKSILDLYSITLLQRNDRAVVQDGNQRRINEMTNTENMMISGNSKKIIRKALLEASVALSWATHHHLTEDDAKECLELVDDALNEFDKCETDSSET